MKEHYYFDNAATSWPKPESVYQYMDQFFRAYGVNPGRSGHTLAVEAETMIVQTRRLIGGFFGFTGDSERVVFTQNATDSLNLCFRGLVASGDHVIITRLEHNSVLRPANHMERDGGVSVTRLCGDGAGYVDPITLPTCSGHYRILKVSVVSWQRLMHFSWSIPARLPELFRSICIVAILTYWSSPDIRGFLDPRGWVG